uniref:Exostosin GT47 domain-containing protein n=1 Tax=Chrysotila carterae TaxID=13221 RepID=A0A7S4BPF1_CHRCT
MLAARYKAADPSWDADVLFKELQHERAVTRVPFFLYDEEDLKIGWREDISKLHQCVQWSRYKHGNDADFLLQLSDHHWRTRNASEADFLVVPVALGAACVSWFSCGYTFSQVKRVMDAVVKHATWRERRHDHIFFGTEPHLLERAATPATAHAGETAPACMSAGSFPHSLRWSASRADDYSLVWFERVWGLRSSTIVLAPYNDDTLPPRLMRRWVRHPHNASAASAVRASNSVLRTSPRMLPAMTAGAAARTRPSPVKQSERRLTQVDPSLSARTPGLSHAPLSGEGASSTQGFNASHVREYDALKRLAQSEAVYLHGVRDIDFFFGGRTSVRGSLVRAELALKLPSLINNSAFISSTQLPDMHHEQHHTTQHATNQQTHHQTQRPTPQPPSASLDTHAAPSPLKPRQQGLAGNASGVALPRCPVDGLGDLALPAWRAVPGAAVAGGAVAGGAVASSRVEVPSVSCALPGSFGPNVLSRARFLLCPRGDTPSSNRLVEAFAFGAIPVLLSDRIYQVGLPFQCFVPWKLLSVQWPEKDYVALARTTQRMHARMEARMRRLLFLFRDDMLWHSTTSRVVSNVLLETARMRKKKSGKHCPCGSHIHVD